MQGEIWNGFSKLICRNFCNLMVTRGGKNEKDLVLKNAEKSISDKLNKF